MKNKIGIIIGREFNERVRKKSFIITTLLTPLLIIALMIAPALIISYSGGEKKQIAVVDESGIIANNLQSNDEIIFEKFDAPISSVRMLPEDAFFAILYIGEDIITNPTAAHLYTNSTIGIGTETNISSQIESIIETEKLKQYNIENIQEIMAQIETKISLQSFKNKNSDADTDSPNSNNAKATSSIVATVIAYVLSFMLYMFLIIYGAMVMQSVIEEKNNRVLEVMVSSVRPFSMMLGKILGVASVAVVQILIWLAILFVAGYLLVPSLLPDEIIAALAMSQQGIATPDADIDLLQALVTLTDIGYLLKICIALLLFMVGGFLLYAALFAAVGSSVDNPQDAQQLQLPITMPIILSLIIMTTVINDPTSTIAFWCSMIPLTSPIVMMARIPYDVPTWEIVVSLILLYATFAVAVWGASKIYRVGILMHGKKPTLKELWRWMRYKY